MYEDFVTVAKRLAIYLQGTERRLCWRLLVCAKCNTCRKKVIAIIKSILIVTVYTWPRILLKLQHDKRRLCRKMQHPLHDLGKRV